MGINPIIPTYPQVGRKESRRGWVRRRKIENNRWIIDGKKDMKKCLKILIYISFGGAPCSYSLYHGDIPSPGKELWYTPDGGVSRINDMLATPLVVAEYTGKPRSIYYTELEQGKKKKALLRDIRSERETER
jgi:hypothetical protein